MGRWHQSPRPPLSPPPPAGPRPSCITGLWLKCPSPPAAQSSRLCRTFPAAASPSQTQTIHQPLSREQRGTAAGSCSPQPPPLAHFRGSPRTRGCLGYETKTPGEGTGSVFGSQAGRGRASCHVTHLACFLGRRSEPWGRERPSPVSTCSRQHGQNVTGAHNPGGRIYSPAPSAWRGGEQEEGPGQQLGPGAMASALGPGTGEWAALASRTGPRTAGAGCRRQATAPRVGAKSDHPPAELDWPCS